MKELKFKCTLLSDVILNRKSATTGPNETLDFIPGSNFLGIVASKLYTRVSPEESSELFHSGKVRFGDAHPSLGNFRGLRVPASMYFPKLGGPEKELFIHHLIPETLDLSDRQLKQSRRGFFDFSEPGDSPIARQVKTETSFAIKSAYDRHDRRSKDEQLFGYQSLQKGLTMYFSVEVDDDRFEDMITDALSGERQIGRSRSAQYGLVRIERADYQEAKSTEPCRIDGHEYATVYADGRLIFLDDYGMPTFQPTAEQLGLKGGIDWEKTQVRTFRYAPWNFKRQSFDTDRCGIEKGSVFVVRLAKEKQDISETRYIGDYVNEGFGRVIYNPAFLSGDSKGSAKFRLVNPPDDEANSYGKPIIMPMTPLMSYLSGMKRREDNTLKVYDMVNNWVDNNFHRFRKGNFASQWGNIRRLATTSTDISDLWEKLFSKEPKQEGYLVHGVAKAKWVGDRLRSLERFVDEAEREFGSVMAKLAVVNLASEMGKKCKQS